MSYDREAMSDDGCAPLLAPWHSSSGSGEPRSDGRGSWRDAMSDGSRGGGGGGGGSSSKRGAHNLACGDEMSDGKGALLTPAMRAYSELNPHGEMGDGAAAPPRQPSGDGGGRPTCVQKAGYGGHEPRCALLALHRFTAHGHGIALREALTALTTLRAAARARLPAGGRGIVASGAPLGSASSSRSGRTGWAAVEGGGSGSGGGGGKCGGAARACGAARAARLRRRGAHAAGRLSRGPGAASAQPRRAAAPRRAARAAREPRRALEAGQRAHAAAGPGRRRRGRGEVAEFYVTSQTARRK